MTLPAAVRRAAVWGLLLALVLAPALGRWHQVLHATPPSAVVALHDDGGARVSAHAPRLLAALFSGHAPIDCLLLDQLALGTALPCSAPVLPAAAPAVAPSAPAPERLAVRHVALFQARGPPALLG
ncbi:hypothetical protein [Acidovorax carolinensis]|uniref:hypothetical protein n=1 Tax=Acidovorax carolinensis TaxID=553814 RepID=UPI001F3985BA|nr:hypothetical protein [Acidovorax carolinensis]